MSSSPIAHRSPGRPTSRLVAAGSAAVLAAGLAASSIAVPSLSTMASASTPLCPEPTVLGGVDLGCLTDHLFVFADGRDDANWQSSSKGYAGDVAVDGIQADERTSGELAFAGTIETNDSTLGAWQDIVDDNAGQAAAVLGATGELDELESTLVSAIASISSLAVTPGFDGVSSSSLDGLDTTDGVADTIVIDVTSDLSVDDQLTITGDADDVFILRWDSDGDASNGLQGQVKFKSGGAIVPAGALTPGNFVHIAGDINASGGGSTPPAPFPQGPRLDDGSGALIAGADDFDGGGFFTGYWLTTGDPDSGESSSMSNAVFVGGWYTLATKFSLTSGTSGVHVSPPVIEAGIQVDIDCTEVVITGGPLQGATLVYTDGTNDFTGFAGETDAVLSADPGKTISAVWVNGTYYEFDESGCTGPDIVVDIDCTDVVITGGPLQGATLVYTDGTNDFTAFDDQIDATLRAASGKTISAVWVNGTYYEFDEDAAGCEYL